MLQDNRPDNCISMKPENLALYLRYKYNGNDKLLSNRDGKPVKDMFGNLIRCTESWSDPGCADQFKAAISMLHNLADEGGKYQDRCKSCCNLELSER